MFLQPGEASAGPLRKYFIPQTAQSVHLHTTIRQFTHRIINFHLHIPCMSTVDISFHLLCPQERIVNKRIDAVCMMYINHISTHLFNLLYKIITMIVAFTPLLIRVDRTERSNSHIEIIVQLIAFLHLPLTGISIDACPVGSLIDIDTSVPVVTPGNRHVQRFLVVEVRIQRTFVCIVIETDLKSGVDISYPRSILIFFHIPFPTDIFRTITAFFTQPHHITANTGSQMGSQADIFHSRIFAGNQSHFIFDISIRFHLSFQIHQETTVLIQSLPGNSSLFMFRNLKIQVLPRTAVSSQFHRGCQYGTAVAADAGHRFFKITGNICRQA